VTYPRTAAPDPVEGRLPPKPYRYSKYPSWDALFDLLFRTGVPASSIDLQETRGRFYLQVLMPGHRFTECYEGADLQAVAQRWLTGEADTFAEMVYATAEKAA
jgi:hypothetical protein